jgi:hypothetical protein
LEREIHKILRKEFEMKKLLVFGLALIMVFALLVGFTGCAIPDKATGGGFLINDRNCSGENGGKVTFGFNVKYDGICASGEFQLVDHGNGNPGQNIIVHGTFTGASAFFKTAAGVCTIKGLGSLDGEYPFTLYVQDKGEPGVWDKINVKIVIPGPDLSYSGYLDGGNIQLHYPKVK